MQKAMTTEQMQSEVTQIRREAARWARDYWRNDNKVHAVNRADRNAMARQGISEYLHRAGVYAGVPVRCLRRLDRQGVRRG